MRKYLRRPNPLGQSPRRLDHHGHHRRRQGHDAWATSGTSQHLRSMSALPPKADIGADDRRIKLFQRLRRIDAQPCSVGCTFGYTPSGPLKITHPRRRGGPWRAFKTRSRMPRRHVSARPRHAGIDSPTSKSSQDDRCESKMGVCHGRRFCKNSTND